jgi:hypothetical protein
MQCLKQIDWQKHLSFSLKSRWEVIKNNKILKLLIHFLDIKILISKKCNAGRELFGKSI